MKAAKEITVSDTYDELVEFFEDFERHLHHLQVSTEIPRAFGERLVEIMVELLGVLAVTMQQIKQRQFSESALNDSPRLA